MRRTGSMMLAAALLFAVVPAPVASGGQVGGSDDLAGLLVDHLGLEADQIGRWQDNLNDVGDQFITFARGGDASIPAEVDIAEVPWFQPLAFGLNRVQWQDPNRLPEVGAFEVTDGVLRGGVGGGPRVGPAYVVLTAVMAAEIPLDDPEDPQQWDFVLQIPGLEQWEALPQFPDDTWNGGSFVLSLRYEDGTWRLRYYTFSGGNIVERQFPGFGFISGDTLILGVESDPSIFSPPSPQGAPPDVGAEVGAGGGHAGQSLTGGGSPIISGRFHVDSPRLVMVTGTRDEFFEYLGGGAVIVPGLLGFFDIVEYDVFVDEDGFIWFKLFPYTPWGAVPPVPEFYSYYAQVFLALIGSDGPSRQAGYEYHAGEKRTFSYDGPEEGDPVPAFIMDDGAILIGTGFPYAGGDLEVFVSSGSLATEEGQFQASNQQAVVTEDEVGVGEDATRYDGEYPVYDLVTGTPVEPPPELTVTTTTRPVSTVTTTSVPATTVTRPTTTVERPPTFVTGETCWWCWGIVALFVVFLVTMLYLWLKTYEWWTCWIPWFIVIFIWVPFLLAGLWFYRPAWWWWPLLAWFPLIGGYTWRWARRTSWWRPWYLYVVGGYLAALVVGMVVVGAPEWGLLLPLFWLPPVAFYLWHRAPRQPWWRPWYYGLFFAYVAWGFVWLIWLTPWWAWWFPAVFFPFLGWWFVSHGYSWREIHGPKWCWVIPFASIPFLAWWIPLWGPWWCFTIIGMFAISLFCMTFNHFREQEWWTAWIPWFVVIMFGVPFLLAGLWFFRPNWWWWPLLLWFPAIAGCTWWWARRRSWWQPWMLYVAGGYLVALAVGMLVVGAPEWGLLFPLFWLPPLAFYVRYRALGAPWWRPWILFAFVGWVAFVLIWVGVTTLGPWWAWWFPVGFFPFLGWWFIDHGYEWDLVASKSSWFVPACLLPWLGFMLAIDCIPHYYL